MPNNNKNTNNTNIWAVDLPFRPTPTPRPKVRFIKGKTMTYYPGKYHQYLHDIRRYLNSHHLYNDNLKDIMLNEDGVFASITFYTYQDKKNLTNIFQKTAPDIDNLVKGVLDAIFFKDYKDEKGRVNQGLRDDDSKEIRDSRIVGIKALKFKSGEKSHIKVTLEKI